LINEVFPQLPAGLDIVTGARYNTSDVFGVMSPYL
jgi:hypothetical protein